MTLHRDDERIKQVAIALGILLAVGGGVLGLWLGWLKLPGAAGEMLGMIVGVMSTPFFLEATFVLLGCLILMAVNTIQRRREGDEWVSPEQLEARERQAARPSPDHP
jgi:hypothetical protein